MPPTIQWPVSPPLPSSHPDFSATSRRGFFRLEGHGQGRVRLLRSFEYGTLVWEREFQRLEPRPLSGWIHEGGLGVVIGKWAQGYWLSFLDPQTGKLARVPHCLDAIVGPAEEGPSGGGPNYEGPNHEGWDEGVPGWLRFSAAGFVDLPGRGPCFAIRFALGQRLVLSPLEGSFVPTPAEQEQLAAHEARDAVDTLVGLERAGLEPDQLGPWAREKLGAATLVVAEQGIRSAACALRALEWGGGPCRPSLRRPGKLKEFLAEVHELRRLAQRALLHLGERPRPLPGATVIRVGPQAALHPSLEARAEAVQSVAADGLDRRFEPLAVLKIAGQPDDVSPSYWDYGVYGAQPHTVRIGWSRPAWGGNAVVERIRILPALAATTRYRGLGRTLDPLAG